MIITDSYVSISDVRDKTSSIIKSLNKIWTKIVLSQNKPVGVFLSVDTYNNLKKSSFLKEKATSDDIKAYKNSSHWNDWVEAFSFLKSLK
jgi:PHD/YefM family antitoxin component YafN of YafNO toxin-antitoxin module